MPATPDPDRDDVQEHDRSIGKHMELAPVKVDQAPPPRSTWREEVVMSYDAYWNDVTAQAARAVDLAKIMRYFDLLELEARMYDQLINEPLTSENLAGTQQTHPLVASLARIVNTSIRLANEIGATPLSRIKLGLAGAEAKQAMKALERQLGGEMRRAEQEERAEDEEEITDAEIVEW